MSELASWDWDTKEKLIADLNEWKKKFTAVRELIPSDDGEKVATVVRNDREKIHYLCERRTVGRNLREGIFTQI